ncbi:MAG: hypothetical protein NTY09_12800 [bacterium]|nr:hypothetical protein [bacterium]
MDSLIDLNGAPESRDHVDFSDTSASDAATSILKPRESTVAEQRSIGLIFGLIGLGVSIGLYLLATLIILIVEEEISDSTLVILISVCLILTGVNVGVAVLLGLSRLRVTDGHAIHSIVATDDGNEIVRKTIMYHRRQRRKAGLEIAKVPSFQFRSSQKLLKTLFSGNNHPTEFSCDGVTLLYSEKDQEYKIPVEMIESAKVVKVQTQYGITKWDVNLKTNLASGYERVIVDALQLQNSEEIEQYCRAIATSFPEKDDGYWD